MQYTANYAAAAALVKAPSDSATSDFASEKTTPVNTQSLLPVNNQALLPSFSGKAPVNTQSLLPSFLGKARCGCAACISVRESVKEICNNSQVVNTQHCIARDLAVSAIGPASRLLHRPDPVGFGKPIIVKESYPTRPIYSPSVKINCVPRPIGQKIPDPLPEEMKYEKKISGVWAVYTCEFRHKFAAPFDCSKKCPVCYFERVFDDRFVVLGNKPRPYNAFHQIYCKICGETFVARRGRLPKTVQPTKCGQHVIDAGHNMMIKTLFQIYGDDFSDYCTDERGAIILSMFIRDKIVSLYSAQHNLAVFMNNGLSQYKSYAQAYCVRHQIRFVELPLADDQQMQLTVISSCDGCLPEPYVKKVDEYVAALEMLRLAGL